MKAKQLAKIVISAARHPRYTGSLLRPNSSFSRMDDLDHAALAAEWLIRSQRCSSDGMGYSRKFSLHSGWDRGYIETTGYIIPTLLDLYGLVGSARIEESALRAGEWLRSVQLPSGAFTDIDAYQPQVFDTGQVLLGLSRLYTHTTDECYLESARKASDWLVEAQESDGSWAKAAYNGRAHTYYSRVGAALIEFSAVSGNDAYRAAGEANISWTLSQQQGNGFFSKCDFRSGEPPLLHTMVYVLEGLIMAYRLTGDHNALLAATRGAEGLRSVADPETGLLKSQYFGDLSVANPEYCVTGLAQWAGICLDLYEIKGDPAYYDIGTRVLDYLCGIQLREGIDMLGGLPSSIPVWGYYGGMELFNWNVKFFIDALIKHYSMRRA